MSSMANRGRPFWLIVLVGLCLGLMFKNGIRPGWRQTPADFTAYYTAGRAWNPGPLHDFQPRDVYDLRKFQELAVVSGVPHPALFAHQTPFCAWLFRLFSRLSWDAARRVWLILNLCFLGLLIARILQLTRTLGTNADPRIKNPQPHIAGCPAWFWCVLPILAIGPPLWNHFRVGQLYLLTSALVAIAWPGDREPGVGFAALKATALAIAIALKPIWCLVLPFWFLANLKGGLRTARFPVLLLFMSGMVAVLLQFCGGLQVVQSAIEPFLQAMSGNVMGGLVFQNQSGAVLASFLVAGFENSITQIFIRLWALGFRLFPLLFGLILLWRRPELRHAWSAGLAFIAVFQASPAIASYHLILLAAAAALFPWGDSLDLGKTTNRWFGSCLIGLLLIAAWMPVNFLDSWMLSNPAVAMWRVWLTALVAAVFLYALAHKAGTRIGAWVWFVVVGSVLFTNLLAISGETERRAAAYQREQSRFKGMVTNLVAMKPGQIVIGMMGFPAFGTPVHPPEVQTTVFSDWGGSVVLTPVTTTAGGDLLCRLVYREGLFLARIPAERLEDRLESPTVTLSAGSLDPIRNGDTQRLIIDENWRPLDKAEDQVIDAVQTWPVGYCPDDRGASWVSGHWSPNLRVDAGGGCRFEAVDRGFGYGYFKLERVE